MNNFEMYSSEIPEDEEVTLYAPNGTTIEPLIKRALNNYKRRPDEALKYFVEMDNVRVPVERNDSFDDVLSRYNSLKESK